MTRDTAWWVLRELDDLAVRVCVQERRLPGDPEVADLKRCIEARRTDVIAYLAAVRLDEAGGQTIH